jgi:hypothetical protein
MRVTSDIGPIVVEPEPARNQPQDATTDAKIATTDGWSERADPPILVRVGHIGLAYVASANRRRKHGHSQSNPLTPAENEVGGGYPLHGLQLEVRHLRG